jgi:aminopeptidase N
VSVDAYAPQSGDPSFRVLEYRLKLRYRVLTNRLDGEVLVIAVANQPLASFRLDLVGLRADRVRVDGEKRSSFRQGNRRLTITPATTIEAGQEFQVAVRYSGSPGPRTSRWGQVGWEHLEDGILVASQPIGAPTWFPCNDRPADKAHYRIELTLEDGYTVAATGRLESQVQSSGRSTWTFADDLPTATYLVALHIGKYRTEPLKLGTVPGTLYYPTELRSRVLADLAGLPAMLALFERCFGPYPMGRYDVVVTPDQLEIPLESQGMAVFGANHLDGEGSSERLVAHELAHQWFGNSVGIARWQDIWLNEGFSCYAEWLWSEEAGVLTANQQAKHHHALLADLPQDIVTSDPGVHDMFDDRVYKRGALTLHALRRVVGDEAFFDILRAWCQERRHAVGTTADFIALAQKVSGQRLRGLFREWLDQTRLPRLPHRTKRD